MVKAGKNYLAYRVRKKGAICRIKFTISKVGLKQRLGEREEHFQVVEGRSSGRTFQANNQLNFLSAI